ncbi:ribosome biogenesis GTPase YqeH [Alicyclobacillus tolerans]|uniref:Ribosome biogenesis GTPase YqeH n=2 Tax=Alicyclobacillus tolerans TaxID=90970 RepID=A0ABT9LSV2_9BACL|nr:MULTISPECIES: ribosome biogenesis GTPase YqeH [Alicyclobacillus]MDP9727349.1 ribosome biogenesis GTPase YqeH [Alicyclobacillus tengchongensis]QRF23091.1 ribosome biogenesis GTPase YqeH [Alicyclobacillus sp. TC]SHJ52203.1 hypothetical protein SAMN05443507_101106 [Alicyclobacillus montanus]
MKICSGCGAELQIQDENAPGYVTSSAFTRENPLCRRCFRLRHYGEFIRVQLGADDYRQEVSRIREVPGRVLYVLDVFDLSGSMIPGAADILRSCEVDLVVNKIDLLPREVVPARLEHWIRREVEKTGVQVNGVFFVSAETGKGMKEIKEHLARVPESIIYALGTANVGKSTLLNRLIRNSREESVFTTSRVPGTTLRMVGQKVEIEGNTKQIMDTPGLLQGTRISEWLCPKCLKIAVPRAQLRPRIYQLRPAQTIFLGGLVRFDFVSGAPQSVVFYVSNELPVHRTKLERAPEIQEHRHQEILKIPCRDCQENYPSLLPHKLATRRIVSALSSNVQVLDVHGVDLVLPGLGWITLFGSRFEGTLWLPEGVPLTIRRRFIGDISRLPIERRSQLSLHRQKTFTSATETTFRSERIQTQRRDTRNKAEIRNRSLKRGRDH